MEQTLKTVIYRYPRRQALKVFLDRQVQMLRRNLVLGGLGLSLVAATGAAYRVSQIVPPAKKYTGPRYKGPTVREMLRYPMATTVWMEARNQPRDGQRAVAHVIRNRVMADRDRWGHGLMGVVTKRKQFSCHNVYMVGKGRKRRLQIDVNRQAFFNMLKKPEDSPEKRQWREIQQMSQRVWQGKDPDNTGGATFYATTSITPYWRYDMKVIGIMFDHAFFREMTSAERKIARRDRLANERLKARRAAAARAAKKVKAAKPKVVVKVTFKAPVNKVKKKA